MFVPPPSQYSLVWGITHTEQRPPTEMVQILAYQPFEPSTQLVKSVRADIVTSYSELVQKAAQPPQMAPLPDCSSLMSESEIDMLLMELSA